MPGFLALIEPYLMKYGVYLMILLGLGGGWLYVEHLRATVAADAVSISELQGVNKANQAAIVEMADAAKRYYAIEATAQAGDTARQASGAALHATIAGAASVLVSPVLESTLNALRGAP